MTKKCYCVNIEIQWQMYKTLYQNLYQKNLWESESESKFYHSKARESESNRKMAESQSRADFASTLQPRC